MSRLWSRWAAAGLLCALGACSRKAESTSDYATPAVGPADAAPSTTAMATATATGAMTFDAGSPAAEADDAIPNEHKAERKAEREITNVNYKAELNKLDKEIGGSP